jgi:broad specificity phosphatase PhoE
VSRLYLVRHGEASAGWDADPDPGLSLLGREQAGAVAAELAPLGPLPVVVSPLRRTRETAEPVCAQWDLEPVVDDRVAEIPSPPDADLVARGDWLRGVMASTWSGAAPELIPWCDDLVASLRELTSDTVVVTHFVAINVAVGRATEDDRVVCFMPGNCSVTVLDSTDEGLRVVSLGASVSDTVVR